MSYSHLLIFKKNQLRPLIPTLYVHEGKIHKNLVYVRLAQNLSPWSTMVITTKMNWLQMSS